MPQKLDYDPDVEQERRTLQSMERSLTSQIKSANRMRKATPAAKAMLLAELHRDLNAIKRVLDKHYR